MAGTLTVQVLHRRTRRRRRARGYPDQLHIFEFRLALEGAHSRCATVLVRGRMGQNAAIGPAYEQARRGELPDDAPDERMIEASLAGTIERNAEITEANPSNVSA